MSVLVVETGVANTAAVVAALRRAGAAPVLASDPAAVARAERLVLPGVGAFAAAADRLDALGLTDVLRARIADGRPTLAICLGLQLLGVGSAESPGRPGLGAFDGVAGRFPSGDLRCPHLGWSPVAGGDLVRPGAAWFAHSYRFEEAPGGWIPSWADHGGRFVAALQRGAVLACQFHPELSGPWGGDLIGRWLNVEGASCRFVA